MPALQSNTSTSETSWEYPAQESPRLRALSPDHSTSLGFASLYPPITRALLRELDIPRLENDLVMRHHLNFDPEIKYRVDTRGLRAEEKRERACQYWNALTTEIAMWLAHDQRVADSHSNRPLRTSWPRAEVGSFPQGAVLRLPRLFGTIRDILKHVLPSEEWPIIDAAVDVRLLMQQLEHGICDFIALSDWLGNYLRRFCSPARNRQLHTMTSAIRLGVENAETDSVVDGLITVFEILQGMNLVSWRYSLNLKSTNSTTDVCSRMLPIFP